MAASLFLLLLAAGTAALASVGNEGAEESFYRALGAFTTSSFVSEPDSARERAIAAILTVAGGLFYLALVGSVVQAILVRNAVSEKLRERRERRAIHQLRDHYLVCGYGRVGRAVTTRLVSQGKSVVVIEKREENINAARDTYKEQGAVHVVMGDADDSKVLEQAGICDAAGLITCVGTDAENVYIALAAQQCSRRGRRKLFIASRASDDDAARNLKQVMDYVDTPYVSAGNALADAVLKREGEYA